MPEAEPKGHVASRFGETGSARRGGAGGEGGGRSQKAQRVKGFMSNAKQVEFLDFVQSNFTELYKPYRGLLLLSDESTIWCDTERNHEKEPWKWFDFYIVWRYEIKKEQKKKGWSMNIALRLSSMPANIKPIIITKQFTTIRCSIYVEVYTCILVGSRMYQNSVYFPASNTSEYWLKSLCSTVRQPELIC